MIVCKHGQLPRSCEVCDLEQQLASAVQMLSDADYEYNRKTNGLIKRHAKQLADCQARELSYREALEYTNIYGFCSADACDRMEEALAIPTGDQSALREVIAQVLEEVAEDWEEEVDVAIRVQADRIRSGKWTPEALK